MERSLTPELLDSLPAHDARARRSRRDLHRLNLVMGHARILAHYLRFTASPARVADLGGGDGVLLLHLARKFRRAWSQVEATLVDHSPAVSAHTRDGFTHIGWRLWVRRADALTWLREPSPAYDLVLSNLFLHHFSESVLAEMFTHLARRTRLCVALEPRRALFSLFFSQLVGLIGCNEITRHDAPASVKAGFTKGELSRLWPAQSGWDLLEKPVGLFGHLFVARKAGHPETLGKPRDWLHTSTCEIRSILPSTCIPYSKR